jgi:hypothetical protein
MLVGTLPCGHAAVLRFTTRWHASELSLVLYQYPNHHRGWLAMILLTTALLAHVPKRRNGENGRRDAHQWDLSIDARLTRQGASPCSTMRYWVPCERCRGSRMCGRSPSTEHSYAPRTAGGAIEWHCRATHPPIATTSNISSTSEPRGDDG